MPVLPFEKWEDVTDREALYGELQQSTGGDFLVYADGSDIGTLPPVQPKYEIVIEGNIPTNDFEFRTHYDLLHSKFIFYCEIIGTVMIEDYGEVEFYNVKSYSLAEYVPNLYSFSTFNLIVMIVGCVTLTATSILIFKVLINKYRA